MQSVEESIILIMSLHMGSLFGVPDITFDHLRTANTSARLNQIERIRANGVGDMVALPQLVVCGDQSAGKSSVLEGITRIPFPRQEGLCTRFPTEIILRHSAGKTTTITASIRPHATREPAARKMLAEYRKCFQDMSELPSIIHDVSRLMNIRGFSNDKDSCAFAPDALRIEVTGPIGLHLSVVDLPGLISVSNDEQRKEDIEAVRDVVATYLQSSRTIILAVLQAGNDIANQPIITLAREYDSQGQRTVGIITKADLINRGTEGRIALIARNQDNIKLKLGFFLVKNPSPSELEEDPGMEERSTRELRFFSAPAWTAHNLDMSRVGIENLRIFLQNLLDAHIDRELPKVREEIKAKLNSIHAELKTLGDARTTIGQIRSFLTGLSMQFYELLQAALEGNYLSINADFFSRNERSRLRARIQAANTLFAARMREHSQRRKIASNASDSGFESDEETPANETAQLSVSKSGMLRWVKQVSTLNDTMKGIIPNFHA